MFQNFVHDHIAQVAPFSIGAPRTSATGEMRHQGPAGSYENNKSLGVSGTGVVDEWIGLCLGVVDPEKLGNMLFTYQLSVQGFGPVKAVLPVIGEWQAPTALADGNNLALSGDPDNAYYFPSVDIDRDPGTDTRSLNFGCTGSLFVNSKVTSATVGVEEKSFYVGVAILHGAALAYQYRISMQARLHDREKQFHQPAK